LFDNTPNHFRAEAVGCYSTRFVDGAEDGAVLNTGFSYPDGDGFGDPIGYWNGSNVATLPDQVGEYPVFFALR
jgi:hypothetical protein